MPRRAEGFSGFRAEFRRRHEHRHRDRLREGRDAAVPLHRRAGRGDRAPLAGPLGGARARSTRPTRPGRWREPDAGRRREKVYVLDMFPYPSGAGLHVGHPLGYIGTDVLGRLPADDRAQRAAHDGLRRVRAARRAVRRADRHAPAHDHRGQHRRATARSCAGWGLATTSGARSPPPTSSSTAGRSGSSCRSSTPGTTRRRSGPARSPSWSPSSPPGARPTPGRPAVGRADARRAAPIVIDAHRLAYLSEAPVNWCPGLGTVLANEEVTADGRSERGNFPVFRRSLRQWMMRITAYADRLIADLDRLDWPESVKAMQRNWIGRSRGRARVRFPGRRRRRPHRGLHHPAGHPVRRDLHGAGARAPAGRRDRRRPRGRPATDRASWTGGAADPGRGGRGLPARPRRRKSDLDRQENKDKTGVFTGAYAINPVNGAADPGLRRRLRADGLRHRRDHGRARARTSATGSSPRRSACRSSAPCSRPPASTGEAFTGDGPGDQLRERRDLLDGLGVAEAKRAIIDWLAEQGLGERGRCSTSCATGCSAGSATGASRSRSSTTRTACRSRCPTTMLPVELPEVDDYSPQTFDPTTPTSTPEPPLAAREDWVDVTLDLGDGPKTYRRETEHDAAVGRLVLVRAALPRPDQRRARSSTPRSSGTGWARPAGRATSAASTCTSAASSTPCCTCCTRGSGTRCCSTWATCQLGGAVPPAVQPGLHPGLRLHRRARRLRARRGGRRDADGTVLHVRTASRSTASTGRWASR